MRSCNPLAAICALVLLSAAPVAAQETVVPKRLSEAMGAVASTEPVSVRLQARIAPDAEPLGDAVSWTVFSRTGDSVGEVAARTTGSQLEAELRGGDYVAHIAFGGASTVVPFTVSGEGTTEQILDLNLGGLRLAARSAGRPIGTGSISFAIHDREGDRHAIHENITPGQMVMLPAGTYRAVVRYGEHNAVTGADIRVHAGELTEATLGVKGAPVSLALVRTPRSKAALATSTWRVFDSGGKPLLQTDEPTPSLVLAPGSYTAEVLHGDWTTVHRFEVETNEPLAVRVPLDG